MAEISIDIEAITNPGGDATALAEVVTFDGKNINEI